MEITKSSRPAGAAARENKDAKHLFAPRYSSPVDLPSCAGITGAVLKAFNSKPLKSRAVILIQPGLGPRITDLLGILPPRGASAGASKQVPWPLVPSLALGDVKAAASAVSLVHQSMGSGPLPEAADLEKLGEALCASIQATGGSNLGWVVSLACMELGARPALSPGALRSLLRPLISAEGGLAQTHLVTALLPGLSYLAPALEARPKLLGAILKLIHESAQSVEDPAARTQHWCDRLQHVLKALQLCSTDLQVYALDAVLRLDDLAPESMGWTWLAISLDGDVAAGAQSLVALARRLPSVRSELFGQLAEIMLLHARTEPLQPAQAVSVIRVLLEWTADLPDKAAQDVLTKLGVYACQACISDPARAGWLVRAIATADRAPSAATCRLLMLAIAQAVQAEADPAIMNSLLTNSLAALQVQSTRLGRDRTAAMLSAVLVADGAHLLNPALMPQQLWALDFLARYAPQAALDHARSLLASSLVSVPSRVLATLREGLLKPADDASHAAGAAPPPLRFDPAGLAHLYVAAIDSLEDGAPRAEFIGQEITALQAHPQPQALAPVLLTLRQARDQLLDQPGSQLHPASAAQDPGQAPAPEPGQGAPREGKHAL